MIEEELPDEVVEKPYSIHVRMGSHPRIPRYSQLMSTIWKFHSCFETEQERDDQFNILSHDGGGLIRTQYMKVGPNRE